MFISFRKAEADAAAQSQRLFPALSTPCFRCHLASMEERELYVLRHVETGIEYTGCRVGMRGDFCETSQTNGVMTSMHIELDDEHMRRIARPADRDSDVRAVMVEALRILSTQV